MNPQLETRRSRVLRHSILLLVVALVLGACNAGTKGATGQPPADGTGAPPADSTGEPAATQAVDSGPVDSRIAERFFPQAIIDPAAENRVAFVFLAPEGWNYEGAVDWMPDWSRQAFLRTRVSDPETGVTVEWLPIQDFIWFPAPAGFNVPIGGNYQGKQYVPPITDPAQFVHDFWMPGPLAHLQNARLVSIDQVPRIADEFKAGFGGPADAFAYRIRYEYDQNGVPWREDVSFALLFSGTTDLTSWYVNFAYTVRGPTADFDRAAGLTSTIIASRQATDEWTAVLLLVQDLFRQGIRQQMADTEAFGRTLAANRAQTQALQAQVTADRLASQDRIAQLRGETLAGVQTFDDPVSGSPVQLPQTWDTYWVNDRGEYLASDQAGFDPNSLNAGTWQRLQPRP